MIISHVHRYVYIAIPRTGSKSMNRWLMDHYDGEWVGYHHDWRVPATADGYLVFTIVRNPYEKVVSGWYHVPWSIEEPDPPRSISEFAEAMKESIPLKDGTVTIADHNVPEVGMNQAHYVQRAGVQLILHFEHLPACLKRLPFVDAANMAPFPHKEERGTRPPGTFFDLFGTENEPLVWAYADDDFEAFGYRRYDSGGPVGNDA